MYVTTRRSRLRGPRFTPGRTVAGLAAAVAVSVLAGCGGSSGSSAAGPSSSAKASASASASVLVSCKSSTATKITFWAWVPGIARAVSAFNASHPSICVTLEDVGAGSPQYTAISNALKAGTGAPDVAEVEFDELPSFEVTHSVVNLVPYGANKYKSKFVPWAWQEVSQGSAVYAMPGDAGPMAFYYNSALLAKYHITPPTTYAQFATAAAALKKADPSAYMTDFAATDLQWVLSLMAQANAWPFSYSGGSTVGINWTGPAQTAFANYWQKLIDAKEVNGVTDMTATSFADLDKSIDASWLSSAWGPSYFAPDAKQSVGAWRAAPLPQWTAGANVAANWGGSTYPVFKQSAHPAVAAEFSEWLNATDASWNITKTAPSSLFPTYLPLLNDPAYKEITVPISGSSHPGEAFTAAASSIQGVPWPPFMTEALTQANTVFAGVLDGKTTLVQAFKNFQNVLVSYAKAQGFTVSGR
ncbi:MAG: multiple sugar transport system substrate-binding protein [Streptosporangiaceae bacterium]|jgi:multiple sugar transport system substrate-binding protein|nr:multiple sugar transport system substrate-binding protein [Streptosporangiaceae bacterium]